MSLLRKTVRHSLLAVGIFHPLNDLRRDRRFRLDSRAVLSAWQAKDKPAPPPNCLKYDCIRQYARRFATPILVETGTWKGDAIFALRHDFREIHSIELAPEIHAEAKKTLAHWPHIHLHFGDSGRELPRVVRGLTDSTLFWLDGHWCAANSARGEKDSPIVEELDFLLRRPVGQNVVLVDDARCFTGQDGYPTVEEVRAMVAAHRPAATFEVADDIIRIVPV